MLSREKVAARMPVPALCTVRTLARLWFGDWGSLGSSAGASAAITTANRLACAGTAPLIRAPLYLWKLAEGARGRACMLQLSPHCALCAQVLLGGGLPHCTDAAPDASARTAVVLLLGSRLGT